MTAGAALTMKAAALPILQAPNDKVPASQTGIQDLSQALDVDAQTTNQFGTPAGTANLSRGKKKKKKKDTKLKEAPSEDAIKASNRILEVALRKNMARLNLLPDDCRPNRHMVQYSEEESAEDEVAPIPSGVETSVISEPFPLPLNAKKAKKKKKKKSSRGAQEQLNNIWHKTSDEEMQGCKAFWYSLSEEERRRLVCIEKEGILKKMKDQQRHSCSCTVCGRKRLAIEEELESLYEQYYRHLEKFANHPPTHKKADEETIKRNDNNSPESLEYLNDGHIDSLGDDLEEEDEENVFDDDEDEELANSTPGFLMFGDNLTIQGNFLTVADDLIKNDGRKFIEMMEHIAERRMLREEELLLENPVYDDEEEEDEFDDEEEYDELEEELEEENDERRMQEGKRMFQIFAAKMFEQRLRTAYREKVAQERQKQLFEELDKEKHRQDELQAKRMKENQRRKDKKRAFKQHKEEERARKEVEKLAEEATKKAEEEKRAEEDRKRRQEERRLRETEKQNAEVERIRRDEIKRANEAERLRKEEERRKERFQNKQNEIERKKKSKEELEKKLQQGRIVGTQSSQGCENPDQKVLAELEKSPVVTSHSAPSRSPLLTKSPPARNPPSPHPPAIPMTGGVRPLSKQNALPSKFVTSTQQSPTPLPSDSFLPQPHLLSTQPVRPFPLGSHSQHQQSVPSGQQRPLMSVNSIASIYRAEPPSLNPNQSYAHLGYPMPPSLPTPSQSTTQPPSQTAPHCRVPGSSPAAILHAAPVPLQYIRTAESSRDNSPQPNLCSGSDVHGRRASSDEINAAPSGPIAPPSKSRPAPIGRPARRTYLESEIVEEDWVMGSSALMDDGVLDDDDEPYRLSSFGVNTNQPPGLVTSLPGANHYNQRWLPAAPPAPPKHPHYPLSQTDTIRTAVVSQKDWPDANRQANVSAPSFNNYHLKHNTFKHT